MAAAFKGREDHRKQMELEEASKAGVAPAVVDEDGKDINFRIPQYMSSAPWCLYGERLSLKNERNWKWGPNYTKDWYDRGKEVFQADKIRKGACLNCGAMTHAWKMCMDGPRKTGAKWTKSSCHWMRKWRHLSGTTAGGMVTMHPLTGECWILARRLDASMQRRNSRGGLSRRVGQK